MHKKRYAFWRMGFIVISILLFLLNPFAVAGGDEGIEVKTGDFREIEPKTKIEFFCYVPGDWNSGKCHPAIVSHHGAGGTGQGERSFWKGFCARHKLKWIIICPTSPSIHRGSWGSAMRVSRACGYMLKKMQKPYRINPSLTMVSGFSGGGSAMIRCFNDEPDLYGAIVARSANYYHGGEVKRKLKYKSAFIVWGSKDHPYILQQGPRMARQFENYKYKNFRKLIVKGMGHAFNGEAQEEFYKWWKESFYPSSQAEDLERAKKYLSTGKFADAIPIIKTLQSDALTKEITEEAKQLYKKLLKKADKEILRIKRSFADYGPAIARGQVKRFCGKFAGLNDKIAEVKQILKSSEK